MDIIKLTIIDATTRQIYKVELPREITSAGVIAHLLEQFPTVLNPPAANPPKYRLRTKGRKFLRDSDSLATIVTGESEILWLMRISGDGWRGDTRGDNPNNIEYHPSHTSSSSSGSFQNYGPGSEVADLPKPGAHYPHFLFRRQAIVGTHYALQVAITQQPLLPGSEKMPFAVTENSPVKVFVSADGFELIGSDCQTLFVPPRGDSDPIIFELLAVNLGEHKIRVNFFQNSRYLGGLSFTTTIVDSIAENIPKSQENAVIRALGFEYQSIPPDLTVFISESNQGQDRRRFKFTLFSEKLKELDQKVIREELVLNVAPSAYFAKLYQELNDQGGNDSTNVMMNLKLIGLNLYRQFFPDELKRLWQEKIRGQVRTIMFISAEPWVPWELIRPVYKDDQGLNQEDGFLCEDYIVSRWIEGYPLQSRLHVSRGALIDAATPEDYSQQQIDFLQTDFKIAMENIEARLNNIRRLLKEGGYQLIHFTGHGQFHPEDHEQARLCLKENEVLLSRELNGVQQNFAKQDHPLVFLNACNAATQDFTIVGINSWADSFVKAGVCGFLGPALKVGPLCANEFTVRFYRALFDGKAVGEATWEARKALRKNCDNPSWLAYTLYGDPMAKVDFGTN